MKAYKALAIAIVAAFLVSLTAFASASPGNTDLQDSKFIKTDKAEMIKDPIKMLERHKERIQQKYKDGKISKEKANEIILKIDDRIKELKDFEKLTLQQKKDKLVRDFTKAVNTKVKDGKITQEKADSIITKYKTKIDEWDGKGYPFNLHKMFGKNCKKTDNLKYFSKSLRFKNVLDKAVKDGKITEQQRQYLIDSLKSKKAE